MNNVTRNGFNQMPGQVFVGNVGQMLTIWRAGRLHQAYHQVKAVHGQISARHGTDTLEKVRELADADARKFFTETAPEWGRNLNSFRNVLDQYRTSVDPQVPTDIDGLQEYLDALTVNTDAIERGEGDPRQIKVMRLAAFAGLRMAEIGVGVAARSLHSLGKSPRKTFADFAIQVEMMARNAMVDRRALADAVADALVDQGCAAERTQVELEVTCTSLHDVPCCIWKPRLIP